MDETSINKCYYNEHSEQTATNYCFKCNKFLCETCSTSHFDANPNHNLFSVDKDLRLNFTGYCSEGHPNKLEYYCSTHNNLCCAACLCKINDKGDGQHTECKVCHMDEIKEEVDEDLDEESKEEISLKSGSKHSKIIGVRKSVVSRISKSKDEISQELGLSSAEKNQNYEQEIQDLVEKIDEVYSK